MVVVVVVVVLAVVVMVVEVLMVAVVEVVLIVVIEVVVVVVVFVVVSTFGNAVMILMKMIFIFKSIKNDYFKTTSSGSFLLAASGFVLIF